MYKTLMDKGDGEDLQTQAIDDEEKYWKHNRKDKAEIPRGERKLREVEEKRYKDMNEVAPDLKGKDDTQNERNTRMKEVPKMY